jgi:hypothetical protein
MANTHNLTDETALDLANIRNALRRQVVSEAAAGRVHGAY